MELNMNDAGVVDPTALENAVKELEKMNSISKKLTECDIPNPLAGLLTEGMAKNLVDAFSEEAPETSPRDEHFFLQGFVSALCMLALREGDEMYESTPFLFAMNGFYQAKAAIAKSELRALLEAIDD